MNFTIYNTTNGKIFSSGQAPDINIQTIPDGHELIALQSNPENDYVANGVIISLPQKPNEFYIFNYEIKEWVPDTSLADASVKSQRNALLTESDWTQIPNNPLTVDQQQAWAVYRQELRDVTSQSGYPFNVIWPTPPQG
jgi:hypothetical protein